MQRRQSGANDPPLQAACVNGTLTVLSNATPSSPRYRAAFEWLGGMPFRQEEWYRRGFRLCLFGRDKGVFYRLAAGERVCCCKQSAYSSEKWSNPDFLDLAEMLRDPEVMYAL